MGLLWLGYGVTFWGWSMVKGYQLSASDVFLPGHYKGKWPPPMASDGSLAGGVGAIGQGAGALAQGLQPSSQPQQPGGNGVLNA